MREDDFIFPEDYVPMPRMDHFEEDDKPVYKGPRTELGTDERPTLRVPSLFRYSVKTGKDGKQTEGAPLRTIDNLLIILGECEWWGACLGFDQLTQQITIRNHYTDDWRPLTDEDFTHIRCWMARVYGIDFSQSDITSAVTAAAHWMPHHAVREYLECLKWDGVPRLHTWLRDYLGAPDDELTSQMGRLWMIGAAKRVYQPGCQMDYTLILKGPQGMKKTTTAQILSGCRLGGGRLPDASFGSLPASLTDKDTLQSISRSWIVEIGELNTFRGKEATAIKDFLTRRQDRFRPPYGRVEVSFQRQCAFIGTTNEDTFLNDPTGSRRFWVVEVSALDERGLREAVDQLWAEAYNQAMCHVLPFLPPHLEDLRDKHAEKFTHEDPWWPVICAWLDKPENKLRAVTTGDILTEALYLRANDQTPAAARRIGSLMRMRDDYEKTRMRVANERKWVYVRCEA